MITAPTLAVTAANECEDLEFIESSLENGVSNASFTISCCSCCCCCVA